MTGVLLADDQALIREGLRMIVEAEPDLHVVAEADTGAAAVTQTLRHRPDVVLMDIRMPGLDGIEATRRIITAGSPARVLILTTFDLDEYVYLALKAGASGFLLKDAERAQLVNAIRTVHEGDHLLAPGITRRLIADFCRGPQPGESGATTAGLSPREVDVIRLLARGLANAEIAEELFLGETTVKSHIARILAKLDLRDRLQVVVFAYESGIVRAGGHE
ncbi:MAG TPA: response regulator transcription factor [Pedococcus sp.]|nr:response regulator transcription factor [Pedococcus sp.]